MYYSKLIFTPHQKGEEVGVLEWENIYQHHQFIWGLFDSDNNQALQAGDFVFKVDQLAETPVIHLLSKRQPKQQINRWQVNSSLWQPDIAENALFQFALRVNPCVKINGKRHDIFLHAKKTATPEEQKNLHQTLTDVGNQFLLKRAESWGVEFLNDSIRFGNSNTCQGKKHDSTATKHHNIKISMVDYSGILKIKDPTLFTEKITKGIGHAKRFGCGLMLINKI